MANRAKPIGLSKKHFTKEEIESRSEAESKMKGNCDLVYKAPDGLIEQEKLVYLAIVKELREFNILNNLDIELIKIAANSLVELHKARINVRKYGQVITKVNGDIGVNPAISILKSYENIYNRCCKELCLSPSSRMAIANMLSQQNENNDDELLKILGGY